MSFESLRGRDRSRPDSDWRDRVARFEQTARDRARETGVLVSGERDLKAIAAATGDRRQRRRLCQLNDVASVPRELGNEAAGTNDSRRR